MDKNHRALEEQLNREILVLEARLKEVSRSDGQQSQYVTTYLERALARRSVRLEVITSLRQGGE